MRAPHSSSSRVDRTPIDVMFRVETRAQQTDAAVISGRAARSDAWMGIDANQGLTWADLDASLFLRKDREPAALYQDGTMLAPREWGFPPA